MPNPILDTGFDDALGKGLGLGLHRRQIDQTALYQSSEEAHRLALEHLAQERMGNQNEYRAGRLDIERERAGLAADKLAWQQDQAAQKDTAGQGLGASLYDQRYGGQTTAGLEGPPSPEEQDYESGRGLYSHNFPHLAPGVQTAEQHAAKQAEDQRHDEIIHSEIARLESQRQGLLADTGLPFSKRKTLHDQLVGQMAALEAQLLGPRHGGVSQVAQQQAGADQRGQQFQQGQAGIQGRADAALAQKGQQFDAAQAAKQGRFDASQQGTLERRHAALRSSTMKMLHEKMYLGFITGKGVDPKDSAMFMQLMDEAVSDLGGDQTGAPDPAQPVGDSRGGPPSPAPAVSPAPPPPPAPQLDTNLMDQIDAAMPSASDDQKAAEYRRRTGGH